MNLHAGEIAIDDALVRRLVASHTPQWTQLPVSAIGGGTDNQLFRLGDELLVRIPRTAENVPSLAKEITWLPRLAPHLPLQVPRPVQLLDASTEFELPWAIYHWIEGELPGPDTVSDWAAYGSDLAAFVAALHELDLMGAEREDGLDGYRGGPLRAMAEEAGPEFDRLESLAGDRISVDRLRQIWRDALALPEPSGELTWMHADLRPSNLLVRDGRLNAVIDFGGLTIGQPDAEHAPVWDLPEVAREAYRERLGLSDETWARGRAWGLVIAMNAVTYYWDSWPQFRDESLARLTAITESSCPGPAS